MKNVLGIILTAVFVVGILMPVFAAKAQAQKVVEQKFERIVAQIVSLDVENKTMVVKREENGETRTIKISAKAAGKVQVGDRVRIKLKAGTNESAGVRVLRALPEADAAAAVPEKK